LITYPFLSLPSDNEEGTEGKTEEKTRLTISLLGLSTSPLTTRPSSSIVIRDPLFGFFPLSPRFCSFYPLLPFSLFLSLLFSSPPSIILATSSLTFGVPVLRLSLAPIL
jgi:hypothetical protein